MTAKTMGQLVNDIESYLPGWTWLVKNTLNTDAIVRHGRYFCHLVPPALKTLQVPDDRLGEDRVGDAVRVRRRAGCSYQGYGSIPERAMLEALALAISDSHRSADT